MKFGQLALLVIASIITFIGLVINKIYQNYIHNNKFLQFCIWVFWTFLALKILCWLCSLVIDVPYTIKAIKWIGYAIKDICVFISSIPVSNGLLTVIFIIVLISTSYIIGRFVKSIIE